MIRPEPGETLEETVPTEIATGKVVTPLQRAIKHDLEMSAKEGVVSLNIPSLIPTKPNKIILMDTNDVLLFTDGRGIRLAWSDTKQAVVHDLTRKTKPRAAEVMLTAGNPGKYAGERLVVRYLDGDPCNLCRNNISISIYKRGKKSERPEPTQLENGMFRIAIRMKDPDTGFSKQVQRRFETREEAIAFRDANAGKVITRTATIVGVNEHETE